MTNKNKNSGFTLIEVLISLVIFAFGMLGVSMQMSKSIQSTVSNEVHSSVMQLSLQSIEPLNKAVLQSRDTFSTALNNLVTLGKTPAFATNNSQYNSFSINVNSAIDSNKNSLLSSPIDSWAPPYTVVLKVEYAGKNDTTLSFFTTHVLVPSESPT